MDIERAHSGATAGDSRARQRLGGRRSRNRENEHAGAPLCELAVGGKLFTRRNSDGDFYGGSRRADAQSDSCGVAAAANLFSAKLRCDGANPETAGSAGFGAHLHTAQFLPAVGPDRKSTRLNS